MKNTTKYTIIVLAFLVFCFLLYVSKVKANEVYKVICHHNGAQDVTLTFANEQAYEGHLGTPHSSEVYDTDGACEEVSPTLSPTPTEIPEGTPSATPTETPKGDGFGLPGDGLSDGRSDGRSSCPECTLPPTTTKLAETGGIDPYK